MSWMARMAVAGGLAEAAVAALAAWRAGPLGLAAALAGGGIATAAQVSAVVLLRPGMKAPGREFMRRWASGMAIRGGAVVALVVLVLATRTVLPPLWTALGFLGVLLTLLYLETRFLE